MRALFDVSMLLASFDTGHAAHTRAGRWWTANHQQGWASCPLTQHGYLRIVSQNSYPRPARLADALVQLQQWTAAPLHEFWPDDITILDSARVDHTRLLGPKQITDIYLLALAVKQGGRLVTLDRGMSLAAAKGANPSHLVVL